MMRFGSAGLHVLLAVSLWSVGAALTHAAQVGAPAPEVSGGPWINSEPITLRGLQGRVVLVEFWTYG
jgi:hypothetical protein